MMTTALVLLVLALPSPLSPMYLDQAKGGVIGIDVDTQTLFYAPLSSNGLTPAAPSTSWPAELTALGVTAPDVAWWGDDPTGAAGKTTHAFTETGSTTEVNTPFCPDGSWSDLTSGCMKARRFDGSNDYYSANSEWGDPLQQDFAVCAIYRPSPGHAGTDVLVSKRTLAGQGWFLWTDGTPTCYVYVEDGAGHSVTEFSTASSSKAWNICCLYRDYDGNVGAYSNGNFATPTANTTEAIDTADVVSIGARYTSHGDKLQADLTAAWMWTGSGTPLTEAAFDDLYEYFTGILDEKGAPVSFTNTGPNCCWVDGALECFGDDWPMLGCELPPGVTGAGSPSSGFYSGQALTNSAVYSRAISSQTAVGAPSETAASTDLFRDGRQTISVCDISAAAVEGESFAIDVTARATGDKIQLCVYAKDGVSSNTVLDLQVDESGVCGGSTVDFSAATIGTTWAQHEWTHTLADGTCTTATYKISPTDWGNAASTLKCAEWVVQAFSNQDWCPPIYIETEAAAVAGGDDVLVYDISGVTGWPTTQGSMQLTMAPGRRPHGTSVLFTTIDASGGYRLGHNYSSSPGQLSLITFDGIGSTSTTYGSAVVWDNGTEYEIVINWNQTIWEVLLDGTSNINTSGEVVTSTSPNLEIGGVSGIGQPDAWLSNVKVTSP